MARPSGIGVWRHRQTVIAAASLLAASLLASSCTTDDVWSMRPTAAVGEGSSAGGMTTLAAYPHLDESAVPPMSFSSADAACRQELKALDVAFRDLAPINDGGECRVDAPVLVSAVGAVAMQPPATLSCNMALAFARWTRKELVPAARWRYWSGVRTIHQGSSYSCRSIAGTDSISEHAKGNALDVMSFELNNGDDIDVKDPGFFAFWRRGFLNNVRADGCSYFSTVLGPGYNYDHRNHFHFDIKERRNGYRACR